MKVFNSIYLTVSDQKTVLRLSNSGKLPFSESDLEIPLQDGEDFTWTLSMPASFGYYSRKYSINITKHRIGNAESEETFVLDVYVDDENDIHICLYSPSIGVRKFDPHTNYLKIGESAKLKIDGNSFAIEVEIKSVYAYNYDSEKDECYYNEECYKYGYA
jgi:hypothetical protein